LEHFILLGYSILVADHEPRIADNLQKMLEGAGAHVLRARSAEEALHCAEQVELFAAVLDYGRSINNDHPIARRLASLGIPFVFLITRNDAWPHQAVVSKPVSGTDLVETLRRLLQPESLSKR
jgi:CheY-like chemotaxis protein